jgi:GldM N-terminal domain
MRNIFFASFISTITLLFSCKEINKTEISNAKILERDFQNATKTIEKYNNVLLSSLKEKSFAPVTSFIGAVWLAKAETIKKYADSVKADIELLRTQLKNEADLHFEESKEVFNENSKAPVHKVFITDNKSELLLLNWATLNNRLMLIDEEIKIEFENTIEKIKIENNVVEKETLNNFKKRFTNITTMEALVILSSIENNVTSTENRLITFCYSKVGSVGGCGFSNVSSFLIGQNTTKLQVGKKLIITAGMGAYTRKGAPKIKINNKQIELESGGIAEYEMKITSKPGKYKIPVVVDFTDENGYKRNQSQIVEYEVVK